MMTDEEALRLSQVAITHYSQTDVGRALYDLASYVRERLTPVEVKRNTDFRRALWLCGKCERSLEPGAATRFCPSCGHPLKWPVP